MSGYSVYKIECAVSGEVYIGQTSMLKTRKREHFNALKTARHPCERLQAAYDKFGADAFAFEVVEQDLTYEQMCEREVYWIDHYRGIGKCFNVARGGIARVSCIWDGVHYDSLSKAASANGISYWQLKGYLNQGYAGFADVKRGNPHLSTGEDR